jgi:hypothetical protein
LAINGFLVFVSLTALVGIFENGGEKVGHGSGGVVPLRAAQ